MTAFTSHYLTPPQFAEQLGVDPSKVLNWIRSGNLRAFDVRGDGSTRPRYRITIDAIVEFEARRSARRPVTATKRKRKQKQDADFVTYF
jgi:predicted site-specific integrase-resolvase